MRCQKIEGCSLERMIGFIIEINQVRELQFILYITRERQRLVRAEDQDIFTYRENRKRKIWSVPIGQSISPEWILDLGYFYGKKEEDNFGLTSKVTLVGGEVKHIPMVDFRCPYSDQGLQRVSDTLSFLGEREGFIVDSGNSYHYWGIHLFTEEMWRNFMKQCKKQEIIGDKWPFFQLRDGFSALRISTSSTKLHFPKIIARIGDFEF